MTVKVCSRCKESKDSSEYHKNSRRVDGLQTYCKVCMSVRNHEYYLSTPERNPQRQVARVTAVAKARDFLWTYLLAHPCVDCGASDPRILEFDHVRGHKLLNVSEMVHRAYSVEKIQEEIDKCEVRCANDHRIRTYSSLGWFVGVK